MTEGGGKKKPLDMIDHMGEHLSSYDGRYLVIPGAAGPYPSYYPYLHQPFLYHHQQIHPHYYTHRGYGGGDSGGCLIENMVGNWSPDLSGTYSPFGGGVPPQPPPPESVDSGQTFDSVLPPGVSSSSLPGHPPHNSSQVHLPGAQHVQTSPQHQAAPKKQRIVAEVKPLRPSYSDVVSKSSAPPLSPATKSALPSFNSKTPGQQPTSNLKEQSRPKVPKQASVQPNNFTHIGGKDSKKDSLSEDILECKKNRKILPEWIDSVKTQENVTKLTKQNNQTANKKNKQSNKQTGREEKLKTSGGKNNVGKNPNTYSASINDIYRKYAAVSDDEQDNGNNDESDDEIREATPPPRQQRLQHAETQPSTRKHTGVKVERPVNVNRTGKSKRSQRASKRKDNKLGLLCKKWQEKCSYYLMKLATWLINLLVDVAAMSAALLLQLGEVVWKTIVEDLRCAATWIRSWWSKGDDHAPPIPPQNLGPASLQQNIQLPTTGDEAMKRLLSCKGKDPYSILGLTSSCSDEDIRRYYRSQALLVHPDKNSQPGAEEAFKILVHAFDLIAEPEKRAAYDRYVSETNQVEQAWSELSDLLTQLHEKMHYAATTIRCNNCGKRHKRTLTERPVYAARYCAQCNIHHSAKEGDMWCEVGRWLFSRRYLACMEGSVYEITDWARCQGGGLADLVPHAHSVHYRVLLGGVDRNNHTQTGDAEFEDLLSSIYGQGGNQPRNRMNTRRKGKKTNKM